MSLSKKQQQDNSILKEDLISQTASNSTTAKQRKSISRKNSSRSSNDSSYVVAGSDATTEVTTTTDSIKSSLQKRKVSALSQTEQTSLTKLFPSKSLTNKSGYKYKIITWNVAGLRALIKNYPDALSQLVADHQPDVICLQETKLQPEHVTDEKLGISAILRDCGYQSHFSCSTVKKGYSGTAVFLKQYHGASGNDISETNGNPISSNAINKKSKQMKLNFGTNKELPSSSSLKERSSSGQDESTNLSLEFVQKHLLPQSITYSMKVQNNPQGIDTVSQSSSHEHDPEGRFICVQLPHFFFINLYVPNSGQKLERLDYRTKSWDKALSQYMHMQSKEWKKPGLWLGDLNVAHLEKDVWNYGAKHLLKQAGCTLEERDSFDLLLKGEMSQENHDGGNEYRDVFRHLHPDASGHYSYWSQRAGNRLPNKGLRLDYFVAHKTMFDDAKANDEISSQQIASKVFVRDSYMLPNVMGSDHCPCVLELELLD